MAYSTLCGLELIRFLAEQAEPASIRDIIDATGIARATTYRTVDELSRAGWIVAAGTPKKYSASWQVAGLGMRLLAHNHTREIALSNVIGLATETGQSAFLSFQEGSETVFSDGVEVVGGRILLRSIYMRLPILSTASGKAMLSHRPAAELEALMSRGIPRATHATQTDPEAVRDDIERSRMRGYGVSDREAVFDTISIAAAIRNSSGLALAAVGLSLHNLTAEEVIGRYAESVQAWARKASIELGYRPAALVG